MTHNQGMGQAVFISCLVFVLFLFLLPTNPSAMFGDPDTFWHLASGDLIRSLGHVPEHDSWSFTAEDKIWQNVSWGWDVILSYIYQHFGWNGVIVMNSMTIAATLAFIFAACFARSQHGIAAFIVTFFVVCLLLNNIRPHQVTNLFTAIIALLLSQIIRSECSKRWLLLIPVIIMLWVNIHGGFLVAFFLLGMHGIDTLYKRNWPLAKWLIVTGIASLIACMINPYGIGVVEATLQYLRLSDASGFISEYQPITFSRSFIFTDLYILLFYILAVLHPVTAPRSEKWIAYSWLFLCLIAVRNLAVFSIVSAPLIAVGLRDYLLRGTKAAPQQTPFVEKLCAGTLQFVNSRIGVGIALLIAAACTLWMFTAQASKLYQTSSFIPPWELSEEINFLETNYPHAHLINHYSLGGSLVFHTRGKIPVFIDGRGTTAYPDQLYKDYLCFDNACEGWEKILDKYDISSVILPNTGYEEIYDRFITRHGWKTAFKGPHATIFMREGK